MHQSLPTLLPLRSRHGQGHQLHPHLTCAPNGVWDSLTVVLKHGDVPIDNNTAERAIRPHAISRKNWFFVGSEDAGNWSAIFFSLIESCRLQKIDPRKYFAHIIPILVRRDPTTDYRQLIPMMVKDKLAKNPTA